MLTSVCFISQLGLLVPVLYNSFVKYTILVMYAFYLFCIREKLNLYKIIV